MCLSGRLLDEDYITTLNKSGLNFVGELNVSDAIRREELSDMKKQVDQIQNKFHDWTAQQNVRFREFEDKILQKIDIIKDLVAEKVDMDSAIISQISAIRDRVISLEAVTSTHVRLLVAYEIKIDEIRSILKETSISKLSSSIEVVNLKFSDHCVEAAEKMEAINGILKKDHEPRIRGLEEKGGKIALNILTAVVISLICGALGFWVSFSLDTSKRKALEAQLELRKVQIELLQSKSPD